MIFLFLVEMGIFIWTQMEATEQEKTAGAYVRDGVLLGWELQDAYGVSGGHILGLVGNI